VKENHETRTHAAHMKFIRGATRYTGADHQRNTEIRKEKF